MNSSLKKTAIGFVLTLVLWVPYSCDNSTFSERMRAEITGLEIITGTFEVEDDYSTYKSPPDPEDTVRYNLVEYRIEVSSFEFVELMSRVGSKVGQLYAESPPPLISNDTIISVEVTSEDTLYFEGAQFPSGTLLNEFITPVNSTWEEFYENSIYIIEYADPIYIRYEPDKPQMLELRFEVSLQDGQTFDLKSSKFVIRK